MEFTIAGITIGALGVMGIATGVLVVWTVYNFTATLVAQKSD